jgi:arabinofuranan 3-O-arabinosyltransferase
MSEFFAKLGRWVRNGRATDPSNTDFLTSPVYSRRSILPYFWHPGTRYGAAWALALVMAWFACYYAWYDFYKPDRPDKTDGHVAIDFGGQYLMGRMLLTRHGKELYFRERQREVLQGAYPAEDQDRKQESSDVEHLMYFTMGKDDEKGERGELERSFLTLVGEDPSIPATNIGGPLYPPINAFLSYPLAWMHPRHAYRINQGINLLLAFLAALAASRLTHGRIWWPVASCFLFVYPGYAGSICLGQNATLTLNILLWGWLLMSRDRPLAGGLVWGLLAFKPVWLLSFLLVPLLTRRWRFLLAMLGTAALLALATLPFVGVHSWLDWLRICKEAAALYDTDENWTFMSRDLYSIPRRWLLDFTKPNDERIIYPFWTRALSLSALAAAFGTTITVSCLRNRRIMSAKEGPAAAFVLLGAWMCCYHFMYYDVLLTALPVCLLFTNPRGYLEPLFVGLWPFGKSKPSAELADYYRPTRFFQPQSWLPYVAGGYGQLFLVNSLVMSLVALLLSIQYAFPSLGIGVYKGPPSDTYALIVLWLWCGFRLLREKNELSAAEELPIHGADEVKEKKEPLSEPWVDTWAGMPQSGATGIQAKPL